MIPGTLNISSGTVTGDITIQATEAIVPILWQGQRPPEDLNIRFYCPDGFQLCYQTYNPNVSGDTYYVPLTPGYHTLTTEIFVKHYRLVERIYIDGVEKIYNEYGASGKIFLTTK